MILELLDLAVQLKRMLSYLFLSFIYIALQAIDPFCHHRDSFVKREKAQEDMYMKNQEREKWVLP